MKNQYPRILGWLPIFSGTPFGLDIFTAGVNPCNHDYSHSCFHLKRSHQRRSQQHPRRRLQHRSNKMGSHPPLGNQLWTLRNLWRSNLGFRQSSWRNYGCFNGNRQRNRSSSHANIAFSTRPNYGFTYRQRLSWKPRVHWRFQLTSASA